MLRLEVRPSPPLRAGRVVFACPGIASLRSFPDADSSLKSESAHGETAGALADISADY